MRKKIFLILHMSSVRIYPPDPIADLELNSDLFLALINNL